MVLSRFTNILGAGIRAVRIYDEQNHRANVDRVSESLSTIDVVHRRIHQGVVYHASHTFLGVVDDASVNVLFQTPADHAAHVQAMLAAGGDADFLTFEGATFSGAGTGITPRNRNRFKADDSQMTVTHTPTLTGDGLALANVFIPGGSGGNASGGIGELFAEIVFAPSTVYLFRATNRAGTAQDINIQLNWYEPNGDDPA